MGLRGIVEIIISPRRVSKNLRRWKLTSNKIYLQISLSWKVTLLLREEEKSQEYFENDSVEHNETVGLF